MNKFIILAFLSVCVGMYDSQAMSPENLFERGFAENNPQLVQEAFNRGFASNVYYSKANMWELHQAILEKKYKILDVLLQYQNPFERADDRNTPLMLAFETDAPEWVINKLLAKQNEILRQYRAEYETRDPQTGKTKLHRMALEAMGPVQGLPNTILQSGINLNSRDNHDNTPLHEAAASGNQHMITALIRAGADVFARNKDGDTPLHKAAFFNKPQSVLSLLVRLSPEQFRPFLNARNTAGKTALQIAQELNHQDVMNEIQHPAHRAKLEAQ